MALFKNSKQENSINFLLENDSFQSDFSLFFKPATLNRYMLLSIMYFCLASVGFCATEPYPSVLNNENYKLFKRGHHKKIMEDEGKGQINPGEVYGSSTLDTGEFFQLQSYLQKEHVKSLLRSYLRFHHHNEHTITPPNKYPKTEHTTRLTPVLYFSDGEKNHYLLKRVNDETFDLILLEYSDQYKQLSRKLVENYDINQFVELARLAQNKIIRVGLYREGSFDPPMRTSREIPIETLSMEKILADQRKADMIREKEKQEKPTLEITHAISGAEITEQRITLLENRVNKIKQLRQEKLNLKKELVKMRLPKLNLDSANTLEEVTLIVQGKIIHDIFNPDPIIAHCPGLVTKQGYCEPNGIWDEKTWVLYRQLYKIHDIAGAVFNE